MYYLFLDDIRQPEDVLNYIKEPRRSSLYDMYISNRWEIVRSYDEFVNVLTQKGRPDFVSFDHDLGDVTNPEREMTGYDCAKYLVEYCMVNDEFLPRYFIHSQNPVGRSNIEHALKAFYQYFQK